MAALTRHHCLHRHGYAIDSCTSSYRHALPSWRPRRRRMQGPQHLGSPAGISALACCGRQANVASMCSSSADAAHADTRSSAPCPHAALGQIKAPASVAAAALVQCLAQRSAQAAEEAAAAAAAAEVPAAPTDVIISVSFTVAILALSIVTVGVLYLSISSFLDKRVEDEERKKYEAAQKAREQREAMGVGAKAAPKRKRTTEELTRGGGKGFGG